tara:strand:- start:156 stop:476 length:321 start_codon:yes stop_codon:yes gene_type:complete
MTEQTNSELIYKMVMELAQQLYDHPPHIPSPRDGNASGMTITDVHVRYVAGGNEGEAVSVTVTAESTAGCHDGPSCGASTTFKSSESPRNFDRLAADVGDLFERRS